MPLFTYVVRSADGSEQRKTMDAASLEEAGKRLRAADTSESTSMIVIDSLRPFKKGIWQSTDDDLPMAAVTLEGVMTYTPLIETLRLYAGWLLAWYFVIYVLGSFLHTRNLPIDSPAVKSLFSSPVIANLACSVFLFLLLSTIHRMLGRGSLRGITLTVAGIILLLLFASNT